MDGQSGERLSKSMRLTKRSDYLRVQRLGTRIQSRGFIGLVLLNQTGNARIGITTTKRLGNAVARNRIKRLVREAFRRGKMNIPSQTQLVVIAKHCSSSLSNAEIFSDLHSLGKRVEKHVEKRQ